MNALSENYVTAWRHVLSGWLLWPDNRIQQFITRWSAEMRGGDSVFFHDPPMYYIAPLLLPRALRTQLGTDVSRMENRIEQSIQFPPRFIDSPDQFDWEAARQRVLAVLREAGAQLPAPDEPSLYDTAPNVA